MKIGRNGHARVMYFISGLGTILLWTYRVLYFCLSRSYAFRNFAHIDQNKCVQQMCLQYVFDVHGDCSENRGKK